MVKKKKKKGKSRNMDFEMGGTNLVSISWLLLTNYLSSLSLSFSICNIELMQPLGQLERLDERLYVEPQATCLAPSGMCSEWCCYCSYHF